jgi:hypothetical protein
MSAFYLSEEVGLALLLAFGVTLSVQRGPASSTLLLSTG